MSINNTCPIHELLIEETRQSRVRVRQSGHAANATPNNTTGNKQQSSYSEEHSLLLPSSEQQQQQQQQEERHQQWQRQKQRQFNLLKWAVLSVTCFTSLGSAYIFDFPGSIGTGSGSTIESLFREHDKKYTQGMNQLLYSVYSWPNTVLAMLGGLLIDKYLGLRRATLIFSAIVCSGAFMFYLGVRSISYILLLLGRVLFGLGGESLGVAQSAYVARWFSDGRGMPIAFCITVSFARVGSSFNFLCSPAIAKIWGVGVAALWGVAACLISFLACVVLVIADEFAVRSDFLKPEVHNKSHSSTINRDHIVNEEEYEEEEGEGGAVHSNNNNNNNINNNNNNNFNTCTIRQGRSRSATRVHATDTIAEIENTDLPEDNSVSLTTNALSVMRFKDIFHIPCEFWLLCGICTFCYGCTAPFIGMGRNFFEVKYGYSGKTASQYLSSYQLTSAVGSPFVGILVDFAGRNTWWLLLSSLSFIIVHVLFLYTMFPALILLIYLGIMASFLSSSLWPAVPWVVQPNMVGFSYGVMTAIQNIGLAIFPIIVGLILDHYTPRTSEPVLTLHQREAMGDARVSTNNITEELLPKMEGYCWAEKLFIVIAIISFAHCVALFIHDKYYGRRVLSVSGSRRKAILTGVEESTAAIARHSYDDNVVTSLTDPLLPSSENSNNNKLHGKGKVQNVGNANTFLSKTNKGK